MEYPIESFVRDWKLYNQVGSIFTDEIARQIKMCIMDRCKSRLSRKTLSQYIDDPIAQGGIVPLDVGLWPDILFPDEGTAE